MKLIFASSNQNKVTEMKSLLPNKIALFSLLDMNFTDEIPETATTIEGNALMKAQFCFNYFKINSFADDTGLEVDALNGAPGVFSARFAGDEKNNEKNIDLLLKKMEGKSNRKARFKTVITLIVEHKTLSFTGIVNGTIRHERAGKKGFGYDAVFEPENSTITFAEMSLSEKNKISHRAKAVEQLVGFLCQTI